MSDQSGADLVRLPYHKIRDCSTPEEEANGAKTYFAALSAADVLKIGTDGNLRDYLPDHPGKKRNMVHKAIAKTIMEKPDRFSQFNSGFLIGASKIEVDDKNKVVTLWDASINNGAQSQGEIRRYIEEECQAHGKEPHNFSVRAEISVEPDPLMRTEIAIARNTMTKIESVSQAGKRSYFNDLSAAFSAYHKDLKIAMSETDTGEEFVDTRQLLQVLAAMMPQSLVPKERQTIEARMRAYKNAAFCLEDFAKAYQGRDGDEADRYEYYVNMAGEAWYQYEYWRKHPNWQGLRLMTAAKQAKRSNGYVIAADGVVFPILAALSNFVKKDKEGTWTVRIPKVFVDDDLLTAARRQLAQHAGKPMLMGRSGPAYESLMLLTEMANRYADAQ